MHAPDRPVRIDRRPLFLCMTALVVLNVGFVQLTEAASPAWLAPLYALAFAAPFLARFRNSRLWRVLWNLGVVGFLGVLVQHALGRDLSSVLEDGLILALLCQVHLLNNLREEQRPDLLFINSYLIALITGYITEDLGFAVAFFLYVPFFVLGLQYLSVARPGRSLERGEVRAVLRDGVARSVALTMLALLVFLLWPRDFQRQPLFARYFDFTQSQGSSRVGFTDALELERAAAARGGQDEYVARVEVLDGPARRTEVPALWRGAVLELVDDEGAWRSAPRTDAASAFGLRPSGGSATLIGPGRMEDEAAGRGALRLRVDGLAPTRRLFVPEGADLVELVSPLRAAGSSPFEGAPGGGVRAVAEGRLRYVVECSPRDDGRTQPGRALTSERRAALLAHDRSIHTRAALDLAERIVREGRPAAETARRLSVYLSDRYRYVPPGAGGAASLHAFVVGDVGGHCELFASTLALMLRANDVPARVVTGFRVDSATGDEDALLVRSSDAHAWVEAYDAAEGWVTLDPSPRPADVVERPGLFARIRTELAEAWRSVTGFDDESRAAALAWLRDAPRALLDALRARPWAVAPALVVACALVAVVRRRRRGPAASTRALVRGFARAGQPITAGETPREALARA
ncbi:MAG: transglutaminaseTgpA domain-containing protein, partial [Planctomycetota bacterium]